MNPNADIVGGACEEVVDILENIPSDTERRAVTDVERQRSIRLRRPASFTIFRSRQRPDEGVSEEEMASVVGEQAAGEEPEEKRRIGVLDNKDKDAIYNISTDEELNPLSNDYIGIIANYFSVGIMVGGSTSLLYPVLIVKGGASASLMTASYAIVMVFWSYKIIFGFLSDCFPIAGYKRKPYIVLGWLFCFGVLVCLALEGNDIDPRKLVIMLAIANMGYVWVSMVTQFSLQ